MGLNRKMRVVFLLILLGFYPLNASALWSGPIEVIQGTWGTGDVQFGFQSGEIKDQFPEKLQIISDGKIIVEDWVNNRLKIYQPSGSYLKSMEQLGLGLYELDSDKVIGFLWDDAVKKERIGVFSLSQGTWLWVDKNRIYDSAKVRVVVSSENIIVWDGKQNGYHYSPTGQLIKTSTMRPLELGKVTSIGVGGGQYRTTAEFPDVTYQFTDTQPTVKFYRDLNRNFFRIETFTDTVGGEHVAAYKVHKYNACSKKIGLLDMPRSSYEPMPPSAADMPTWKPAPVMEYGEPFVAPNGDVYAWARTTTHYSILKWTWVDDPNVPSGPDAPTGLTLMPSTTGLYLTWTASPGDPGCVTGYEISRATTSGGVFSTVATVEKGVVKYNDTSASAGTMYYYKVRAKAGTEFSPFTAEVSGKR